MTFLNMQTRTGELINQALTDDTKTVTLTEVKATLNIGHRKAINALVATNQNYLMREATASLVADQSRYSLPTDFRKMRRVEVAYASTSSFAKADRLDRDSKRNPQFVFSTANPVYYIVADHIQLDPTPASNVTNGLKMWYIEDISDMSADADTDSLPPGYDHIPILYAVMKAKQRLGLEGEGNNYYAEYQTEVEQMVDENTPRSSEADTVVIVNGMDDLM